MDELGFFLIIIICLDINVNTISFEFKMCNPFFFSTQQEPVVFYSIKIFCLNAKYVISIIQLNHSD